jgi:hypothetical protein
MANHLRDKLAAEVQERGASAPARELGINRTTLLSFVGGSANAGTEALIAQRDADRRAAAASK